MWALLLASLLLYCAGRFLNPPQPHPTIRPGDRPVSAPSTLALPGIEPPPAVPAADVPASAPSPPATAQSSETEIQPSPPLGLGPVAPAEPETRVPAEVLARRLEAPRAAETRWPASFGVAIDEGSTLGLGRLQLGYGRSMADSPAHLKSRNGTALEEPGFLFVRLRVRF